MESGRRERGKTEKLTRICRAASDLLVERGYEAVTTQQVADRADIAHGTLFRYVASKSELLLMLHNDLFDAAVTQGEADASRIDDPADQVLALIAPVIYTGRDNDENVVAYQRNLLFGPADAPFRLAGLQIVARFENLIADCLTRGSPHDADAIAAARAVFAAVHMEIAQPVVRALTPGVASDALRRQIGMIVAGYHVRAQHD